MAPHFSYEAWLGEPVPPCSSSGTIKKRVALESLNLEFSTSHITFGTNGCDVPVDGWTFSVYGGSLTYDVTLKVRTSEDKIVCAMQQAMYAGGEAAFRWFVMQLSPAKCAELCMHMFALGEIEGREKLQHELRQLIGARL